ncbi:hypothetical protein PRIC1_004222 [Phytophthora ramorum]
MTFKVAVAPTSQAIRSLRVPNATNAVAKYKPGKWDIFMLGITIVIGGQYFCWNAGIAAGLYSFFISYLLIATAYVALCCCTAEITGALPFAGGAYGLARCTLGFYPAFMIGCCEALEYIAYVSTSTIAFVDLIVDSVPEVKPYRPLLWGLFYLSALIFHIKGGRAFWLFNMGLGVVSLLIVVLFCFGSLPFVNFAEYAVDPDLEFVDGFPGFMKALPLAAWFFVGVEALPMASDQIQHAKHIVPIAQVACVVTLFVTGVFVYFVTASLPPGLAATASRACSLIVAMATSKLLPAFLSKTTEAEETPYAALIAGTSVSYALCLVVYWVPSIGPNLFNICMLSGFMSYTGQCVGYISLKHNYRNIKSSEFQSPFGSFGALYSMCVWVLSIVGIVGFQGNGNVETLVFLAVVALLTVFYFAYARKRQTFSPQENRVMLVAHVTKFNIKKVAARRKNHESTSTTSNSQASEGRNSKHGKSQSTELTAVEQTHFESPGAEDAVCGMKFPNIFERRSTVVKPLAPPSVQVSSIGSKEATTQSPQLATGPSASHTTEYRHGKLDIFTLGITIVIGGQYFCWNEGVNAGVFSFLIGYLLIASAYITLCCCTAEITGALPFAGGSYGLARCTLGFYPAFMIGCCEALEYIAYVSTSTIAFVDLLVDAAPSLESLSPLLWALFYASALVIQIKGGRAFWVFNLGIGIVSFVIVVLYCLGSLAFVDFGKYGSDPNLEFAGGFAGFIKALPLAAWFFVGVEALSLSSDQVDQPKKIVPVAQVSCVLTLFVTGFVVYFVTASLPPGLAELPQELVPFNRGFELMFNVSHHAATVLSLPATYATAFGFMWCYGKLIVAMATSNLLPKFLSTTTKGNETPYGALLAGSAVSYALCTISYFVPDVGKNLFKICILSAFMSYTGQCIGYIALKRNYRNIKSSEFRSPFGIAGAVYSAVIWVLAIISVAAFQGNGGVEIIAFSLTVALLTIFYFGYARKRQTFSAAENRVMLVAHVTKFNVKKMAAGRRVKNQKGSSGSKRTGGGTETSQTESKWGPRSAKSVARSMSTGR